MSKVTRWWWIRHAPVTVNQGRIYGNDDPPCDTSNHGTFKSIARLIPAEALWVTTHLQRTHQTADAIAAHLAHDHDPATRHIEPDFAEQDFGEWQGKTHAELNEIRDGAWHQFWLSPAHEVPPGGESFEQVIDRVTRAVEQLNDRHAGRDIVAVAHGGTIRAAVAHALALSPERALAIEIANCALTRLDHIAGSYGSHAPESDGAWRVSMVNFQAD